MNKVKILIVISFLIIFTTVACSNETKAELAADEFMKAIKERDLDIIDKYLPETGLSDLMYADKEGFEMYCNNLEWKIKDKEENDNITIVTINAKNSDMVSLLKENPPTMPIDLPDFPKEDIDNAEKIDLELKLTFKEDGDNISLIIDEEMLMDLLNIITGGSTRYLEEYNAKEFDM